MKITIYQILMALLGVAALVSVMFCTGCTNETSKDFVKFTVTDPNGIVVTVIYRGENSNWSLLSITERKDSEYTNPLSSTLTGEVKTASDPNSIEAAGDASGGFFGGLLKSLGIK